MGTDQTTDPVLMAEIDSLESIVPKVMIDRNNWVVWMGIERDNQIKKIPYNPASKIDIESKSNDPSTWGSFAQSVAKFKSGEWHGLGFMLAESPIVGVDLDGCRCPTTGELAPWALPIIVSIGSYTEISPSGTGVKIFAIGQSPFPIGKNCKIDQPKNSHKNPGIEVYDHGRYFAFTGLPVEGYDTIEEVDPLIIAQAIHSYLPPSKKTTKPVADPKKRTSKKTKKSKGMTANIIDRARSYLAKCDPAISGQGGHDATFRVACKLIQGFSLSISEAAPLFAEWNNSCVPPWDNHELMRKLDEADNDPGERGYLLSDDSTTHAATNGESKPKDPAKPPAGVITNVEDPDDENLDPLSMRETLADFREKTKGWPHAIGNRLFVDGGNDPQYLNDPAALFGWAASTVGKVDWRAPRGAVTKSEVFAELSRTATRFEIFERLPHVPLIQKTYYSSTATQFKPKPGPKLEQLLKFFFPATLIDSDLILAAFVTPMWGGQPGCRPCFVFDSDDGPGSGKTSAVNQIANLYGGKFEASANEDFNKIKTRLLSVSNCRVALLDNVKSNRFSWAEFEGLITSTHINGHRMYQGDGSVPNLLTWFITLNGACLSTDMAQRAIVIKIKRPKRSGDWAEKISQFIESNRSELISEIMYFFQIEQKEIKSYSRWAGWEREILSRLPDPIEAQKTIGERQNVVDVEADEREIVEDFFAEQISAFYQNCEKVFVPIAVATDWFCRAINEKKSSIAVGRILKRLANEKNSPITESNSRTYGRGIMWWPKDAEFDAQPHYDLKERINSPRYWQKNEENEKAKQDA